MPKKRASVGRSGSVGPTKKKTAVSKPTRIWLKISRPGSISTVKHPAATPAMAKAAERLLRVMSGFA